jgi:thymidylate kinase
MEKEDSESIAEIRKVGERKTEKKGFFIVIDGLDGIGKGEIERALITYESEKLGRVVFDTVAFSKANRKGLPELQDFWNPPETYFDTIVTAEPTYAGIGHNIRKEITRNNGRKYTAEDEIQAYSIDRLIQMLRVVIPALKNNLRVIQSRSCASTLTYQTLRAIEEGKDPEKMKKRILEHEGNKLQLSWAPDLLIIPKIDNVEELIRRLKTRSLFEKHDDVIFENLKFQEKLAPLYTSTWLKEIFESHGSTVAYLDASISPEETRRQAIEIYKRFLDGKRQTELRV